MKPREKLLKYGVKKLEGWELVATILGTGIKGINVFNLSKKVHKIIEEKKENICVEDLLEIKGIGKIKAISIISAFELASRYFFVDNVIINTVEDIIFQIKEYRTKKQEYFLCLTLDGANRLINLRVITIGLLNQSLVHPREVFIGAIEDRANSIIVAHNHPSGTLNPSKEDLEITSRIQKVGEIIGIKLLDHIIITKDSYFSFFERELL